MPNGIKVVIKSKIGSLCRTDGTGILGALEGGPRGRRFKFSRSDQKKLSGRCLIKSICVS